MRTNTTAPGPTRGERAMVRLARLLTRVFFREIEVSGANDLPSGPVVLVANHSNGLIDGLVLMAVLDRFPRFLGKATLFKIYPIVPLLRLARVIPVHRAKEGGTTEANRSAFRSCHEILRSGGLVALFPEGISHDEAALQPLRTGAARIALEAATDGVDGVAGVTTIAVGLVYDDKATFRSRGLVRIGEPVTLESGATDDVDAVRALTADLDRRLRAVGPNFATWDEARIWTAVAEVTAEVAVVDGAHELERVDDRARALATSAGADAGADEARAAMRDYDRALVAIGVTDADVRRTAAGDARLPSTARIATKLALVSPVVATGLAVHAMPYSIMKQIGKLPDNEGVKASVKVLGCLALFTATYTAIGIVVGRRAGVVAGMAAMAAAPVSGWVTLRTAERLQAAGGVASASRALAHPDRLNDLLARRARVVAAANAMLASDRPTVSDPPIGSVPAHADR